MKKLLYISKEDFYEVRLGSMLASYDRDLLSTLYQPIIGYSALSLYFTLWSDFKRSDYKPLSNHESLSKMMGEIEMVKVLEARQALEAIGLLKTYVKKLSKDVTNYIYVLYAPKSPEEFFNDPLYKGILASKIGASEVEKLALIYSVNHIEDNEYEDVSAKFSDIYSIDEVETLKVLNIKSKGRKRKSIKVANKFDIGDFFKELKLKTSISSDAFTKEDIDEILRISTLFGLDILAMVDIVDDIYDKNNINHINYNLLYKKASKFVEGKGIRETNNNIVDYDDNDKLGEFLNTCNGYSPFEYLKIKSNLSQPAPADVNIINILSSKYNLTPPVINVVVDYTIEKCDGVLSKNYAEKIASTLARKNIDTALGAVNALRDKKYKAKTTKRKEHVEENVDEDISLEELDKLFEGL